MKLIVPAVEVHLGIGHVVIRSTNEQLAGAVQQVLTRPTPPLNPVTSAVAVDGSDEKDYCARVSAALDLISQGRAQKVIVSRRLEVPFAVDLVSTYVRGRRDNSPARSFLLELGERRAAGFPPETVVEASADGLLTVQPLAGTRPLGHGANVDRAMQGELQRDPKEVYEHALSVKAACGDMEGICMPGSVRIEDFLAVKARGSVQHLGSTVRGRLRAGLNGWDALQAAFPAVTASGIPRRDACQFISRLESCPRGLYAGAVLMADSRGALDAALVLRTVVQEGGQTWLQAGAGIVAGSTPKREFSETCDKMRSVARNLVPQ
jgi:salicylate synthase